MNELYSPTNGKSQIYGIGLATIDILINTNSNFSHKNNSHLNSLNISLGGTIGNVLVYLAYFGINPIFLGRIGNDMIGSLKKNLLKKANIKVLKESYISDKEKDIVCCFTLQNGDRSFSSATDHKGRIDIEKISNQINSNDILLIDGHYCQDVLSLLALLKDKNPRIILSAPKPEPIVWPEGIIDLLPYINILICGENFINVVTKRDSITDSYDKLNLNIIVIQTQGEGGSIVITPNKSTYLQPPYKTDVIDTLGAGDAFCAAVVYGYYKNWDLVDITDFASFVAGYSCKFIGTQLIEHKPFYELKKQWRDNNDRKL